jgi:transcription initiation factor TFIIB
MRFDFSNRYISNLVNSTRIDSRVERLAAEIAHRSDNHLLVYGKSPNGLAASYLYLAAYQVLLVLLNFRSEVDVKTY